MENDLILVIVVGTALAFDFTNGFHDTANVVATSISTRAMAPRLAVGYAAVLNFVGAFLSLQVASTIANGIVNPDLVTLQIVFAGLIGAISWNLITWYYGLPSSSSHALIGGVVGAAFVVAGRRRDLSATAWSARWWSPGSWRPPWRSWSPGIGILGVYRIVGRLRPGPGQRRVQARAGHLRRAAGVWRTARTTPRRRWASSPWRLIANGNLGRGRRDAVVGGRDRGRPPSRSAPIWAAGGSSRRWAAGSSRWTRPRASRRRAVGPR